MVQTVISRDIDLMVLLQNAFIVCVMDYIETNYKTFIYRANSYSFYYYCEFNFECFLYLIFSLYIAKYRRLQSIDNWNQLFEMFNLFFIEKFEKN